MKMMLSVGTMSSLLLLLLCSCPPGGAHAYAKMADICYNMHPDLRCTCSPSEQEVRRAECVVARHLVEEEEDKERSIWRTFHACTDLEWLRVTSLTPSFLRRVPYTALERSPHARHLIVRHAHIPVLRRRKPARPQLLHKLQLQQLELVQCSIRKLEPGAFEGLESLEELVLSENEIAELRRSIFTDSGSTSLKMLQVLLLDRNRIQSVDPGAFEGLGALRELSLAGNLLEALQPGAFDGLDGLRRLELQSNRLRSLRSGALRGVPEATEIDAGDNLIERVDSGAFDVVPKLVWLRLAHNRIGGTSGSAVDHFLSPPFALGANMEQLIYLDLSFNRMKTLREADLEPLRLRSNNRSHVYLEGNNFTCDCRIRWMLDLFRSRASDPIHEWKHVRCIKPRPFTKDHVTNNALDVATSIEDVDESDWPALIDLPEAEVYLKNDNASAICHTSLTTANHKTAATSLSSSSLDLKPIGAAVAITLTTVAIFLVLGGHL